MPSLEAVIYHYCRFSDGLRCRLRTAVAADATLRNLDTVIEEAGQGFHDGIPEFGHGDFYSHALSILTYTSLYIVFTLVLQLDGVN